MQQVARDIVEAMREEECVCVVGAKGYAKPKYVLSIDHMVLV